MALKKNNNTESNINETKPELGAEGESTMTDKFEAPAFETEAEVETTTAVATRPAAGVAKASDAVQAAKNFQNEVNAMRDALNLEFGSVPMFKANQGKIGETDGDKRKLGRYVKVRLLSWNERWEISTGDASKTSKDFLAFSKDGRTIDNVVGDDLKSWIGKNIDDYLQYLRNEEDFKKANKRQFIDCGVAVLESETEEGHGEIVNVSLSPSSIRAFEKYQSDLLGKARAVELGLPGFSMPEDPFTFYFICEDAEKGDNQWTKLKIASNLPAKF